MSQKAEPALTPDRFQNDSLVELDNLLVSVN
jgi:hypothetical protein